MLSKTAQVAQCEALLNLPKGMLSVLNRCDLNFRLLQDLDAYGRGLPLSAQDLKILTSYKHICYGLSFAFSFFFFFYLLF